MEYRPNTNSITSESAPLIEPVDSASDQELFMVPLKRPTPRLPPSRYRNVKSRSPPRSPAAISKRSPKLSQDRLYQAAAAMAYHSPPLTGNATMKASTPPMPFGMSPLMSPEISGSSQQQPIYRPSNTFSTPQLAAPSGSSSMMYHSPPMSDRNMPRLAGGGVGSSSDSQFRAIMSPEPMVLDNDLSASAAAASPPASTHPQGSPNPQTSGSSSTVDNNQTTATRTSGSPRLAASTKASSVYSPPASKKDEQHHQEQQVEIPSVPAIPPLSTLRALKAARPAPLLSPSHLAPPIDTNWTVPDSPLERLSQLRATRDSAYDRAREMEIRRSEWKHVVYRFPVQGAEHRIIDVDLTESSHGRLADVARRSSEGFEWNGEYEYAEIYRVLYLAHLQVMGEMRVERVGANGSQGEGVEGMLNRLRAQQQRSEIGRVAPAA